LLGENMAAGMSAIKKDDDKIMEKASPGGRSALPNEEAAATSLDTG
jgi:hypothetical protein